LFCSLAIRVSVKDRMAHKERPSAMENRGPFRCLVAEIKP